MMRAPTTLVICSGGCGKELRGTECADGFRVRRHKDRATGKFCDGANARAHQPVVVFRRDTLAGIVQRNFERIGRSA